MFRYFRFAPMDVWLLGAIALYQREVSPRKRFRCAHSVLHGGAGCSGAVQSLIRTHGWRKARRLARRRFHDCHRAAQTLHARQLSAQSGDEARETKNLKSDDAPKGEARRQKPSRRGAKRDNWIFDWCVPCDACEGVCSSGARIGTASCRPTPCDCNLLH